MLLCPYCLKGYYVTKGTECAVCRVIIQGTEVDWWETLSNYRYTVKFSGYRRAAQYPGRFNMVSEDRVSTIAIERAFQNDMAAEKTPEAAFLEIMFWKMYSQGGRADIRTDELGVHLQKNGATNALKEAVIRFSLDPTRSNATHLISACGFKAKVIAAALTYPAFFMPKLYPMIDTKIAGWVNTNHRRHNIRRDGTPRIHQLVPFKAGHTSLQMNDFESYLAWVKWCQKQACLLDSMQPSVGWRARDVEMACFTDTGNRLPAI